MFLGVNLYVHSIYMVCLCSCYILRFLPFSPNAGSGSQKTNILSTCGFLILTQLLLSNAILPQSGEPQSWHQNMERMKHYSMFAAFIGSHWKNIGAYIHLLWFDNPSFNASLLAILLLKNHNRFFSYFEIELTLIIHCTLLLLYPFRF